MVRIVHDMLMMAMEEIVHLTGFEGGIYFHRKILEAIINNNEAAAMDLMREHIKVTISKIKEQGSEQ